MTDVRFVVDGIPVPQGSMIALTSKSTGKAMMIPSNKKGLGVWRNTVVYYAREAMRGRPLLTGPLSVEMYFQLVRPKSISEKKRLWPHVKPDLSKLVRAVEDALTGTVWVDDAQVVHLVAQKTYGAPAVSVIVTEFTGDGRIT